MVSARKRYKKFQAKKKTIVSSEENRGESSESSSIEIESSDGHFIENMSKKRHSTSLRQQRKARLSKLTVPLNGLPLWHIIDDVHRAATILQWVTISESISQYLFQSSTFALPNNYRNKMDAIAWTRIIDSVISEEFWAISCKNNLLEVSESSSLALSVDSDTMTTVWLRRILKRPSKAMDYPSSCLYTIRLSKISSSSK